MLMSVRDMDVLRLLCWCQNVRPDDLSSISTETERENLITLGLIKRHQRSDTLLLTNSGRAFLQAALEGDVPNLTLSYHDAAIERRVRLSALMMTAYHAGINVYVLMLLESYNERARKIAVLRYNLEHPAKVSRSEQIEAMNFGHGDGLDHSAGHISNKTLYIALNYEEQAERMNAESAHEIAKELFALECEQRRLTYFIGLLDKRQAEVIRLVFVDGIPTKEVAASFGLTYRTIDRIKRTAIENLAEMYAYSDQFRV